jgi:hypothetical protein
MERVTGSPNKYHTAREVTTSAAGGRGMYLAVIHALQRRFASQIGRSQNSSHPLYDNLDAIPPHVFPRGHYTT